MTINDLNNIAKLLIDACEDGNLSAVKALVSGNVPIDHVIDDWNPVSLASARGHNDIIAFLLERGADPQGAHQRPSLQCAASGGHASTIKLLLDNGADPTRTDGNLPMALAVAAELGSIPSMAVLLDEIGEVDQLSTHHETPLHRAAYCGGPKACEWLLDHGSNLEARNEFEETPLFRSIIGANPETVELLLERGAKTQVKDIDGRTISKVLIITSHQLKQPLTQIEELLNRYRKQ